MKIEYGFYYWDSKRKRYFTQLFQDEQERDINMSFKRGLPFTARKENNNDSKRIEKFGRGLQCERC